MTNLFLFSATVLIWGTTWIAIAWQIGPVDIIVSIFYRFGLAFVTFITGLYLLGKLRYPAKWRFVVLQALCLFSFNFICFYNATSLMPSGLVSVIFSMATIFNVINARIFFKETAQPKSLFAGMVGAVGLLLLFWQDLAIEFDMNTLYGIIWAMAGTMLFSLGNMMSRKNNLQGVSPVIASAWGMGIGTTILFLIVIASGAEFVLPTSTKYLGALFYLSVVGTVLGFTAYLMMVARLGSDRAAYATVLFPVVALILSTFYEDYTWHYSSFIGCAVTIIGNLIMFSAWPKIRHSRKPNPI